jgi:Uma2 family endonuclease
MATPHTPTMPPPLALKPKLPEQGSTAAPRYQLADLEKLPREDGYRYEIIKGELIVTPAPGRPHMALAGRLVEALDVVLKQHNPGWSLMAQPISLERETEEATYHCQPDLCIFDHPLETVATNETLFPVIVIEIVSPGNPENDYIRKVEAYAILGITEYWIVDPANRALTYLYLHPSPTAPHYQIRPQSTLLPAWQVDLAALFAGLK